MSRDIVKVNPASIQWKVSGDLRESADHDEMRTRERRSFDETDKSVSIRMRYAEGRPWEETPLFSEIYRRRFENGESIRGCANPKELLQQYYTRVDDLYADMRAHGFRVDATPIPVYIGHDGAVLIGDQGNHRLAMAKTLGLTSMSVKVTGRHPDSTIQLEEALEFPDLPDSAKSIPAMTTDSERVCYYRLTKECASRGAIVELGAWLGASTAYIAAGMRDSGVKSRVQVYDRFIWKPSSHDKKAGRSFASQIDAFKENLGPLMSYVKVHKGELSGLKWKGGPVSLLVCDAPKRTPEIASVLSTFTGSLKAGALMAWQDFAYFPSYDIPAAMIRLQNHVEFVEAAYPGTTVVFRVTKPWTVADVSASALETKGWTAEDIESAWDGWAERLPKAMRPRFACGAALFLCDIGETKKGAQRLAAIIEQYPSEVLPKWRYLITERSALMQRYRPLVDVVQRCA